MSMKVEVMQDQDLDLDQMQVQGLWQQVQVQGLVQQVQVQGQPVPPPHLLLLPCWLLPCPRFCPGGLVPPAVMACL